MGEVRGLLRERKTKEGKEEEAGEKRVKEGKRDNVEVEKKSKA